ncbi:glycoside hydrolase family 78 protein [Aaosphaeria arxii CBS 175.79]|uniref:Glycoside hydrolase family 78 protein n=1 Tax=Aaosphaeria arxii CBS 175.79 TaxID=1450172 RepID=A0A6A5YB26_9PLEO|nr:glycoside hydrolase family 78 protein [Aaosphaeria arxii CBS 175.79]KAF2022433.1 glycoside hydrolase family 78 protein [Aaosphaeria arxii CBS 175.79]
MFGSAITWSALLSTSFAASCWRDTICSTQTEASFPGRWEANIYSPQSRTLSPQSILISSDKGTDSPYSTDEKTLLNRSRSEAVFDFGIEAGGVIAFDYESKGGNSRKFGLAFTEARDFIGRVGDSSRADSKKEPGDGALLVDATKGSGHYVLPTAQLRGGFRYLTVYLDSALQDSSFVISNVTVEISFQPTWSNLRAYGGYFHSNDELLNKIWYAGAYTVQTNSVSGSHGRNSVKSGEAGWRNDAFITKGSTVLLDGAKRDRWVWAGDLGVAVPSAFVSLGELNSTKYALLSVYDNQRSSDGALPKAGPPYVKYDSDAYHLWAMVGAYNYFLYSGDVDLVESIWPKHQAALGYALSLIDNSTGVVKVQQYRDWGRLTYGDLRSSASMLTYRERAATLKNAIMEQFWDENKGAFTENPKNSSLYPQDANSFALSFGVVSSGSNEAARISDYLASRWTPVGPSCPELPENVSPFISSVELSAHVRAGRPDRTIDLARTLWGWYLNNENGTQSTVSEGHLVDGSWFYRFNMGYANPSYMSHAHSWSSGPTSVLTEHIVGLRVTEPAGESWEIKPVVVESIDAAEAGFTTKLGKFSAKIEIGGGNITIEWDTPSETKGNVVIPDQEPLKVNGGKGKVTRRIN